MQIASSSATIREHVLELVWSLWAELGVSSWTRRHELWAVDPEPLILFTAYLSETDRRLRDEAIDWCIRYGEYVSATRLRNLLKDQPAEAKSAFEDFAAVVNAHSAQNWPSTAEAPRYQPSRRSSLSSFEAPALIVLRLRALFGVAARADILRVIASEPARAFTASELVPEVNYTKRNIDNTLETLKLAGLLEVRAVRNQHQYRLTDARRLLGFIGQRPQHFPRWTPMFGFLTAILSAAPRIQELGPAVQMVEASRLFRQIAPFVEESGVIMPAVPISGAEAWSTLMLWAEDLTTRLARGDSSVFR
jgi:predicted transcriptional regulator